MEQDDIQELISQSRHGDTRAFEKLVAMFQPLAFRLAFRLLCNGEDAKDVVQEVFVRAWLQLGRYNPRYRFSTWIYAIAANMCYDRLRAAKRNPDLGGMSLDISELKGLISTEDVESAFVNRELREHILYLTGTLSAKQKIVFMLRDVEGLEAEEVARVTGLSAGQIKSNLYLARKYIKGRIGEPD
ncbi:MAG: sigma-70 family RNA polymerase sigma factor [Prevotellaceae bacterium]|jgi:RNA polymerase sigma-70 factor (ECF subfamily)|nr:sigma-70 family RNA polymerase sigma factor [Prevotellaceae bacterium]